MKKKSAEEEKEQIQFAAIDLFCGAGGLTRGLIDSGINVIAGFDLDKNCMYPYEENNKTKFYNTSIRDINGAQLSKLYPKGAIKILAGCAPCQPFSNYTQSKDKSSCERWGLLYEFSRLIQELDPDVIIMENVPDITRHGVFNDFLKDLRKSDYKFNENVNEMIISCSNFGIPQERKRLVLIASKEHKIKLSPQKATKKTNLRDAIEKLPPIHAGEKYIGDTLHYSSKLSPLNLARIKHSKPGGTWNDWPEELIAKCHKNSKGRKYSSTYGRMTWGAPSPTITTQFYNYGSGRYGHPQQDRALSLREGAIIQTFPLWYKFTKPGEVMQIRTIGRLIGNAVPVKLGEAIGICIKNSYSRHLER